MNKFRVLLPSIFVLILAIKIFIALKINAPSIASDEPCVSVIAQHLASNFELEKCHNIVATSAGTPFPLYSILISPIYLFFKGKISFQIILILNSLLVSSLVFPLFYMLKSISKNSSIALYGSALITFLPFISLYENTIMTETLFIVLNVWTFFFYFRSIEKNSKKDLFLAIVFSLLSTITRPFGFLLPLAIIINEFAINRNREKIVKYILPIITILLVWLCVFHPPSILNSLNTHLNLVYSQRGTIAALKAVISQIMGITLTSMVFPVVIGTYVLIKTKNPLIRKVSTFIVIIIGLNILISTNHIFSYFKKGFDPGTITRYVQLALFYFYFLTVIGLASKKEIKLDKTLIGLIIISASTFLLNSFQSVKLSLNKDIGYLYNTAESNVLNMVELNSLPQIFMFIAAGILVSLLIPRRKTICLILVTLIIATQSSLLSFWIIDLTKFKPYTLEYFEDKNVSVAFAENYSDHLHPSYSFWKLLVIGKGQTKYFKFGGLDPTLDSHTLLEEHKNGLFKNFDYLVSRTDFNNLELVSIVQPTGIGGHKTEKIYKLK